MFILLWELFPLSVDYFDDMINNNEESNIFKRIYRFSREELTKSSSFAIEHASQWDSESCHKKKSIVVSGHDGFISSLNNQRKTSESHKEKEERVRYGKDEIDFSSYETDLTAHSFKSQGEGGIRRSGEYGDRKLTRKNVAVSQVPKQTCSPRDSSLIW